MKRYVLPPATVVWAWPLPVCAHHALYGRTPETPFEGFTSGFAHPIIEPLHLAAIIAVGVLCGLRGRPASGVAAFVTGSFLSTWAIGAAASGQMLELAIAISVFMLGTSILVQLPLKRFGLALGLFLIGAIQGAAYAEAIVGAGVAPLFWYLAGLTIVQGGMTGIISYLSGALREKQPIRPVAGVILSGIGAFAALALIVSGA